VSVQEIESIFGFVNREVWIVTADGGSQRDKLPQPHGGLVASWAGPASIDLEHPTVSLAIAVNHYTHKLIESSGAFALHLILPQQRDLVWRFATGSGSERDKLADLPLVASVTGSPILKQCLAWLDCRVIERHVVAERCYYWADVIAAGRSGSGTPLREHELFATAGAEQVSQLRREMLADVAVQRPLIEKWRAAKNLA